MEQAESGGLRPSSRLSNQFMVVLILWKGPQQWIACRPETRNFNILGTTMFGMADGDPAERLADGIRDRALPIDAEHESRPRSDVGVAPAIEDHARAVARRIEPGRSEQALRLLANQPFHVSKRASPSWAILNVRTSPIIMEADGSSRLRTDRHANSLEARIRARE